MLFVRRYRRNLKAFYIVHPTLWARIVTWFFTTFTASSIKEKVHFLSGIQYLYDWIDPDQLEIPAFVLEYDMKVNNLIICLRLRNKQYSKILVCFSYRSVTQSFNVIFLFLFSRKMETITTLQPVRTARGVYKRELEEIKCRIYQ